MKLRGSVLCTQCKDENENVRKQNSQWARSVQPCWTNEAKIKTKNKQQTKGQNKRRDRHANPLADLRIGSTHEATPPGPGPTATKQPAQSAACLMHGERLGPFNAVCGNCGVGLFGPGPVFCCFACFSRVGRYANLAGGFALRLHDCICVS